MGRFRSASLLRLSGAAGVAGGLGWMGLTALTFAVGGGVSLLGYGTLDLLTPVALALAAAGVAGFRTRSQVRSRWGRLTAAGFVALLVGLLGAAAGSAVYVAEGLLAGWTISVWAYFLALVGATIFGVGLLWDGAKPRSGAVLLAGVLPVGISASVMLAFAGVVPDETIVPVGPGALLGAGVAVLGWWVWQC